MPACALHACSCSLRTEEASDPMEMELQTAVSCPVWVLGTDHVFSSRAKVLLTTEQFLQPRVSPSLTKGYLMKESFPHQVLIYHTLMGSGDSIEQAKTSYVAYKWSQTSLQNSRC